MFRDEVWIIIFTEHIFVFVFCFWPLLLEKACAKFCGSYAHLDGGSQAGRVLIILEEARNA